MCLLVIFNGTWEYVSVESIIIFIGIMCYEDLRGLKREQFEMLMLTERAFVERTVGQRNIRKAMRKRSVRPR